MGVVAGLKFRPWTMETRATKAYYILRQHKAAPAMFIVRRFNDNLAIMKIKFIQLTPYNREEVEVYMFVEAHITGFYEKKKQYASGEQVWTEIGLSSREGFKVKETPKEILDKIEKA